MMIPHDDHRAPSAALRPQASGSRPRHGGRDHRHRSRSPSLDGPWVARDGPESRSQPGRPGPEGSRTPARSPGAPATHEEAQGTASARPCPPPKLGIHVDARRLPDGPAKITILRAVDRARESVPLRALLRFLHLSPSRFHAWRRRQHMCALDDQSSCPHTSPHRLTPSEVRTIKDMVTALEYRHVPTGTLAVLAQRLGKVWASPSTWFRLVRKYGWRRPRLRVHPAKPKIGLRTTRADEMWHIDTTVIRLLDGTRAYLHAVIDNFSRRILAWRVAETFAPVNSVAVLVAAGRALRPQRRLRSCWRTRASRR